MKANASFVDFTPNLAKMRCLWVFMVLTDLQRSVAICFVVNPSADLRRIPLSIRVNPA